MTPRIAIVDGVRSPFCRSGGVLAGTSADDLAASMVRELLLRQGIPADDIDEVVIGNVGQPAHAANIARVIALKAGIPENVVAHTVHHNCASGMRSVTTAARIIGAGDADLIVSGGTESMSQIPLIVSAPMTNLFAQLMKAKTARQRLRAIARFRPSFLKPIIALKQGLTDPVCGLNMGETAEVLAREFGVTREEQDAFALESHRKALDARSAGRLAEEIATFIVPPSYRHVQHDDDGPREGLDLERLARLRPYFDRHSGTVTVGNACPITDGAVALLLASERAVRTYGLKPIAWMQHWAYAALDGRRMGLGPVYAAAKLLERSRLNLRAFDLFELNEAFSAQVIANQRAFASDRFAQERLDRRKAVGEIDPALLNVNGGAIALGHPVGATGSRLILTLAREMQRRGCGRGLATLCVGGGQGAAIALEAA